ncbi:hypothetical protein LZ198_40785 [Myxococcus sp. K15C18031901]|uniref:hypothetical protein n=1 Tax=Myxococcus dinghuensis TaxID=2906761 RepID=UPI0020A77F35|nr:hypothetical protein [Myxococcus dinghuensis]MCP3105225.1 hypothetical protein [Myxococcus dinghuensis]
MATWNDLILATPRQIAGKLQDEGATTFLETFLRTEGEQVVLLGHLHRGPHLLREGAFNDGRVHLEAATRPYCARDERMDLVRSASHCFTEALRTERDAARLSLISLHLGICGLLLGGPKDAREWTSIAHQTAVEALKGILSQALAEQAPTRNRYLGGVLNFIIFFTSSATLGAGYLAWDRLLSKRTDKVLRRALARMEPLARYIETVREIRLRLGEPASVVPRYEVTPTLDARESLSQLSIRTLLGDDDDALDFNGRETRRASRRGPARDTSYNH